MLAGGAIQSLFSGDGKSQIIGHTGTHLLGPTATLRYVHDEQQRNTLSQPTGTHSLGPISRFQVDRFDMALVLRNVIRVIRCPFIWDSEFWLAMSDLSVLLGVIISVRCRTSTTATTKTSRRIRYINWCFQAI